MGFGGAVSAMVTSLRNNEKQRNRRKHFDKDKVGGLGDTEKPKYDFPEATPQTIRAIRDKMQEERRKFLFKSSIAGVLFLFLVVVLLIYLG